MAVGACGNTFVFAPLQREYEEFKVKINSLVAKAQKKPEEGWVMQDGTPWPGNNTRDHPGMIQVWLLHPFLLCNFIILSLRNKTEQKDQGFYAMWIATELAPFPFDSYLGNRFQRKIWCPFIIIFLQM